jgi:hypothetical protein
MGVFGHNDLFSKKFDTAIVRDSQNRGYFIHIRNTLDEYFISKLNGTFYAFSLKDARIITHRWFGMKTFRWIDYDTTHYKSIEFDNLEALKLFLVKNSLPRMNILQQTMIKMLGRKERKKELKELNDARNAITQQKQEGKDDKDVEIPPHDIEALLKDIAERQDQFPQEATNLTNYIKGLDIDTIVTPCRKISEYIEDDLIATNPTFLGELLPRVQRLLGKHGEITNSPYSSKNAWMMKLVFISFIGIGIAMILWMNEEGFFDQILSQFPDPASFSGAGDAFKQGGGSSSVVDQCSDKYLQDNFTPEALKIAQDNGSNTCALSETLQASEDGAELPKAAPKQ